MAESLKGSDLIQTNHPKHTHTHTPPQSLTSIPMAGQELDNRKRAGKLVGGGGGLFVGPGYSARCIPSGEQWHVSSEATSHLSATKWVGHGEEGERFSCHIWSHLVCIREVGSNMKFFCAKPTFVSAQPPTPFAIVYQIRLSFFLVVQLKLSKL